MEKSEFEGVLNDLYKDVCEWLKFAEAKNAALLGFNGVMLFGTVSLIKEKIFPDFSAAFKFSLVIFCLNIVIIMFTFIPTEVPLIKKKKEKLINGLYYGEVGNYEPKEYLNLIIERYNISKNDIKFNNYISDLANQIVSVSWLAIRKNKIFKFCALINICLFVFIVFWISLLSI